MVELKLIDEGWVPTYLPEFNCIHVGIETLFQRNIPRSHMLFSCIHSGIETKQSWKADSFFARV